MADGDVKDLQNLISSIDENSKSTTDNINQILGILQNLDRGGISSNKKNNKKTGADNTSSVTSMLKAVNNVTPKLQTFSTNISDINRGLKSLSNTISKFNQGIKSESVPGSKAVDSPKNALFNTSYFTDIKNVLVDIKKEIESFHAEVSENIGNIGVSSLDEESKNRIYNERKERNLKYDFQKSINERGLRETLKDNKFKEYFEKQKTAEKHKKEYDEARGGKIPGSTVTGRIIGGITSGINSFATGNIDASSIINSGINTITGSYPVIGGILKLLKTGLDVYNREETFGRDYARTYGGGAYGKRQFMQESADFRLSLPNNYGIGPEDYYNSAVNFSNYTGRQAYRQTHENLRSVIDLKRMGIEGAELGLFDTFGKSMSSTADYFNKLYGTASTKGLSFKKMTDAIKSNLKMAQTYTFSNGVNGLQKMAETSTRLKYNMSEVARFAEKVNTVEGAIKTAANLSVLGGDFAQFSNPMGLLYESLNDMEGLNKRMVDMFSKMARWDSSRGQIDISSYDKERIKRASEAMGVDANEMMNIAMNRAREERIKKQVTNPNISGKTLDYIMNLAQLDENGNAYISDKKGTVGEPGGKVFLSSIEKLQKILPSLKEESEAKNLKDGATIGDIYLETRDIYSFLNDNLKGVSGKLSALTAHFIGGTRNITESQKLYLKNLKTNNSEEYNKLLYQYGGEKKLKQAIAGGEFDEKIDDYFGGTEKRLFYEKNLKKYLNKYSESDRSPIAVGGSTYGGNQQLNVRYTKTGEDFLKEIQEGKYNSDIRNNKEATFHTGIAGNTNERFARILRGESVLTRRGTDILGKSNVRALNSGQLPAFEKIRLRTAHDYLNNLPVTPLITQRYNQAQGQQKIAFEPIMLTINGQFNVNSGNQFRNIPLDDIDTRALKKAILDTVTENIPTIMRKANILNNRGYDMENDRYRGAIQGSYI